MCFSVGFFKCNVDASSFKEQGLTGMGCCIKNDRDQFVVVLMAWIAPLLLVREGEALALL